LKSSRDDTGYCITHGGGKRCQQVGCSKSARGDTQHCVTHGGGRRCQHEGCPKGAEGDTLHCKAHGGGKRCQHEGCAKSVAKAAGSTLCTLCLRATKLQPDGAEAEQPAAPDLPLSLREREAIQRLVEDFA
jgi:hypothetical protein